jgi:hypothetical protein
MPDDASLDDARQHDRDGRGDRPGVSSQDEGHAHRPVVKRARGAHPHARRRPRAPTPVASTASVTIMPTAESGAPIAFKGRARPTASDDRRALCIRRCWEHRRHQGENTVEQRGRPWRMPLIVVSPATTDLQARQDGEAPEAPSPPAPARAKPVTLPGQPAGGDPP